MKEIKKYIILILLGLLIPSLSFGQGTAIENGINWLKANQNSDGSWDGLPESLTTTFHSTAEVLNTFYCLGKTGEQAYLNGIQWIGGQDVLSYTDYFARQIKVLAESEKDVTEQFNILLSYQNPDGGWPGYPSYSSEVLDTVLVLSTFTPCNYSDSAVIGKTIGFILFQQNPDGSFGFESGIGNIYLTSLVLITLSPYQATFNISANIEKATTWLLSKQNSDGSFGTSVFETSLAYSALIRTALAPAQTQKALDYIKSTQLANGSWNNNAYETALALRSLSDAKPNLTISSADIVFNPATPYEGVQAKITAAVRNSSGISVSNAVVKFYLGAPLTGTQIGSDQVISSISAGGAGIAEVTWNTTNCAGLNDIYVVVDPENTIEELNEDDNISHGTIEVLIKPIEFVDLVILPENIYFEPANPTEGDLITITAFVGNQGQTDLFNVEVSFYLDSVVPANQIGSVQIIGKISSGSYGQAQIPWNTTEKTGNYDIYVVVDPNNKIPEGNETNNTVSKGILIAQKVNLPDFAVTNITTSQVNTTIQITATVSNKGLAASPAVVVNFYNGDPIKGGALIEADQTSPIPSSNSASVQVTWSPSAGQYNIYIVADPQNCIPEGNELNNTGILELTIAIPQDLVITSDGIFFNLSNPTSGETVTILAYVGNSGVTTLENIEVNFYLGNPAAGGIQIGTTQIIPGIGPGNYGEAQVSWNTTGLTGTKDIYVVADPNNKIKEDKEDNNKATKDIEIAPVVDKPDLLISNLAAQKTDTQIKIIAEISNNGLVSATNILVRFYDGDPTKGGVQIGEKTIPTLDSKATVPVDTLWTPTAGEHQIYVAVDPLNTITEGNELNNTGIITITIVEAIDLIVKSEWIYFAPENPTEGDQVTITGFVGNQGSKDLTEVKTAFYCDSITSENQIGSVQTIAKISAGTTEKSVVDWDTFSRKGTHTIYFVADPANTISEDDETNNTASKTITVAEKVNLPDFAITNINFSKDWPNINEEIVITAQVVNKGLASAANIPVKFYDGEPGKQGTVVIGTAVIPSLDIGATSSVSIIWSATPSGQYKIYVVADPDNAIPEGNELNNSGYAEIGVGILPDFSISSDDITFSHTDLTLGLEVSISTTIHNIGLADANTAVAFYDGDPAQEENLIALIFTNVIKPGGTQTLSLEWYPKVGTHTLYVKVDPLNNIPEINETNNSTSKLVEITIPGTLITLYKVADEQKTETDIFGAYQYQQIVVTHRWPDAACAFAIVDAAGNLLPVSSPFLIEEGIFTWYTSHYSPGNYTVIAFIVDLGTGYLLEQKEKGFTVEPTIGIRYATIFPDKNSLIAGKIQEIALKSFLGNGSNVETTFSLYYEVTSPSGVLVTNGTKEITVLPDTESLTVDLVTFTNEFPEIGSYVINLQVLHNSNLLTTATGFITSVPLIRIEPGKTVTPDKLFPADQDKTHIEIKLKGIQE